MKIRLLKSWLGNTSYIVHCRDNEIRISNGMINTLISIDINKRKMEYHLGNFNCASNSLLNIWNKLLELISDDKIKEVINGDDSIEGMIPIYTVECGKLVEKYSEGCSWPNITHDGELIFEGNYFRTMEEAIENGIKEIGYKMKFYDDEIAIKREALIEIERDKELLFRYLNNLRGMK